MAAPVAKSNATGSDWPKTAINTNQAVQAQTVAENELQSHEICGQLPPVGNALALDY